MRANAPEVRRFYRVAVQRMEDAQILFANLRTTGAMYLAGYAAECALKALLLDNVPIKKHNEVLTSFRGRRGHDWNGLKNDCSKQM